jgi:hypothetical protein
MSTTICKRNGITNYLIYVEAHVEKLLYSSYEFSKCVIMRLLVFLKEYINEKCISIDIPLSIISVHSEYGYATLVAIT